MLSDALKSCGVYAVRSAVNGRTYIGHSVNIQARWRKHRSGLRRGVHGNQHLQRAWNKYGEDAFEFVVLEECPIELLLEREQHYFDTHPDKYNIALIAGSPLGHRHTQEAKAKISAALIGNTHCLGAVHSYESRAINSASKMGHEVSSETREKLRVAHTGRKHTDEAKANMSAASKGRKHTPESKAKLSAALRGRPKSDETRSKMSASQIGRIVSPETRDKISASQKAKWERKRAKEMVLPEVEDTISGYAPPVGIS